MKEKYAKRSEAKIFGKIIIKCEWAFPTNFSMVFLLENLTKTKDYGLASPPERIPASTIALHLSLCACD